MEKSLSEIIDVLPKKKDDISILKSKKEKNVLLFWAFLAFLYYLHT
jgi:hypothetical protein